MDRTKMSRISNVVLCSLAFLAATLAPPPLASGQEDAPTQGTIERIKLDKVPLSDALRIVAQRTGRNYILDPGLCNPRFGPDGKPGQQPSVSVLWENLSAEEALGRLLKGYGLVMVTNPASSVLRQIKSGAFPHLCRQMGMRMSAALLVGRGS
jgi:hypothetical protein